MGYEQRKGRNNKIHREWMSGPKESRLMGKLNQKEASIMNKQEGPHTILSSDQTRVTGHNEKHEDTPTNKNREQITGTKSVSSSVLIVKTGEVNEWINNWKFNIFTWSKNAEPQRELRGSMWRPATRSTRGSPALKSHFIILLIKLLVVCPFKLRSKAWQVPDFSSWNLFNQNPCYHMAC